MFGQTKLLTCGKKGPITFINSSSTLVTASARTISVNVPSGSNPGDLMIIILQMRDYGESTDRLTPDDPYWVQYQGVVAGTAERQLRIFTRKLGVGETSFSAQILNEGGGAGANATRMVATILTYRNALPHLTGHGLFVGRTGNGAMDFPSMDPTKPGIFICVGHTNDGSTATLSTPSGMTLLMSNSPSTTNIGTSVFVETMAAAGATGTRTTTMASNFIGYALGVPMFLING